MTIPDALARDEWVVRTGDTGAMIYDHQLWTQGLAADVAQSLTNYLNRDTLPDGLWADAGPTGSGSGVDLERPATLRVRVQVLRLDSLLAPAPAVSDQVRWTIECLPSDPTLGPVDAGRYRVVRTAVRDAARRRPRRPPRPVAAESRPQRFDRVARAHSETVRLVAEDIAGALRATAADAPGPAPALRCSSACAAPAPPAARHATWPSRRWTTASTCSRRASVAALRDDLIACEECDALHRRSSVDGVGEDTDDLVPVRPPLRMPALRRDAGPGAPRQLRPAAVAGARRPGGAGHRAHQRHPADRHPGPGAQRHAVGGGLDALRRGRLVHGDARAVHDAVQPAGRDRRGRLRAAAAALGPAGARLRRRAARDAGGQAVGDGGGVHAGRAGRVREAQRPGQRDPRWRRCGRSAP